jgi:von Willebrand factor type A domain
MEVRFLTPVGALFALAAVLPLAVLALRERRVRRVRGGLRLPHPALRSFLPLAIALAAVALLLGLAATQPVVETDRTVRERIDAEAFVVLDVSRSMLAAADAGAPTRLDRAKTLAQTLRQRLPQVPVGLLSLTDRVLPHLFPSADGTVFAATAEHAIGIERPPPGLFYSTRATDLGALVGIPRRGFFSRAARKRLLVVLTDGETQDLTDELRAAFARKPLIETFFVHVWNADEAIYETGVAERGYEPDPASARVLASAAAMVDGRVFREAEAVALADAAAAYFATGPTRERVIQGERLALMPYATLAVLLPLGFVLLRRNL